MKNEEKNAINDKTSNSKENNNPENINKILSKNVKLYQFVFLVDEEVGNSFLVKAFPEFDGQNNLLLNKNNSIKIELCEIKIKEIDKLIKSIDGIIFINNIQDEKKLNKNMEIIMKLDKQFKKSNSKKFFPKLIFGNSFNIMKFFENKKQDFYHNDVYIFEISSEKPVTINFACENLIKMNQINDNYKKFLTEIKIDEKKYKHFLRDTSSNLNKCSKCNHIYNILIDYSSDKINLICKKCNIEQRYNYQEYLNILNNNYLECNVCKKKEEKKHINFCKKCKNYICGDCIKKHIQKEYCLKDENYKLYRYRYYLMNFYCNVHNKICNGYCFDCEENICPKCEMESHLSHKTRISNNNEIFTLIKEQKESLFLERTKFEKMKEIMEDCLKTLKDYFENLLNNKRKELEIKEKIIKELETFKYDNILINNIMNLEFENYEINYDRDDSLDKKINNIFDFFKKRRIKMKKHNLCCTENLRGPYDILQIINLNEGKNDDEYLTDLCFLNNYKDKNFFAASFNNGLLKIYNDNFDNRIPLTIIKEFEINESINSLQKSTENSLLLVSNLKIKKIQFSDDFIEYKVIKEIVKKDQLFKMAFEIGEFNYLFTINDYNQIRIYDFINGKELYKSFLKDDLLLMEKISENKILLKISKNNLMNSLNIDNDRNSIFLDIDNIDKKTGRVYSEIFLEEEKKDIFFKISELEIINNEIKIKSNYQFDIKINYIGKIDDQLILLYNIIENKIIIFNINTYETIINLFSNSSLEPIFSLPINKSVDSYELLILCEGENLAQCILNSKYNFINVISKLKIEKIRNSRLTIKHTEENNQKNNSEIKKIICFTNDNFLIITKSNLIYNLKNFN